MINTSRNTLRYNTFPMVWEIKYLLDHESWNDFAPLIEIVIIELKIKYMEHWSETNNIAKNFNSWQHQLVKKKKAIQRRPMVFPKPKQCKNFLTYQSNIFIFPLFFFRSNVFICPMITIKPLWPAIINGYAEKRINSLPQHILYVLLKISEEVIKPL